MKSKKKLIIALSSLCFVVVAAVVTVSVVLAAINQTVTSNISVKYTAQEVAGTVSAKYQVLNGDEILMTTDASGSADKATITFVGGQEQTSKALLPKVGDDGKADIILDVTNKSVTFTYTFTNTGSAAYIATLTYKDDWTGEDDTTHAKDANTKAFQYSENFAGGVVTVPAGSTGVTVSVTVEIDNLALNAEFSGTFNWALEAQAQA